MAEKGRGRTVSPKHLLEKLALWDDKTDPTAPLTDQQKDAFMDISSHSSSRPMPQQLPYDESSLLLSQGTFSPKQDQDTTLACFLGNDESTESREKIENAQQFFSWFAEVEDKIEKEEEEPYRDYISELHNYRGQCNDVLAEVTQSLDHLYELHKQYIFVSTKTNALHEACEHLLAEQTSLMNEAESISNKLSYFNELDLIASKLGAPTLTVTSESFVPMLSRLDECILYLQNNPRYKESDVYLARFRQSLSRALNLVKSHVVTILQNATQHVIPKKDNLDVIDNAFTLFYGKFRANAPRVKSLMEQIEQRIDKSPEYKSLLADCHYCYFTQRETLLGPSVASAISDLAAKHIRDHCSLMRSGCAFVVHVCEDEYQLYFNFFSQPTPLLDEMLEKLCNNLYDIFRPLIIHINHLETLAELCSILKVEMMEEHVQNNSSQLAGFESICKQMLMDVQERLVYRTHIYIRTEILNYAPASGDLAYPEKLEMMKSIAESTKKPSHSRTPSNASSTSLEVARINGSVDDDVKAANESGKEGAENGLIYIPLVPQTDGPRTNMPMSPADLHGMWYPTVRRTLVCLSKLYRCIDKTTFQGLSQEALSLCIQSLNAAKAGIVKRKTHMDGELFLIKHLLILREQIMPFHAEFSVRETILDFSKFMDAAYSLFQKKSQLFVLSSNNALLQLLFEGTPQVSEHFVDSKKEVDTNLKMTCEDFIRHVTETTLGPLTNLHSRADVILQMQKEDIGQHVTLRQQPFAAPEKVHDVIAETYKNLKTKIPAIKKSMALYLANKDTESILFKPIKANIQQTFTHQHQVISPHYSEEDQQIIACPAMEQINLLLSTPAK